MKKTISILAVLFIAATVFASGMTAKVGLSYGYGLLNPAKDGDYQMSASGFGLHMGALEEFSYRLTAYADVYLFFPDDITLKAGGETKTFSEVVREIEETLSDPIELERSTAFFITSAGVAYKLDFNALELTLGGGFSVTTIIGEFSGRIPVAGNPRISGSMSVTSFGLSGFAAAEFKLTPDFGVGITATPHLGLISVTRDKRRAPIYGFSYDDRTEGFEISLAMPVSVGISYTF